MDNFRFISFLCVGVLMLLLTGCEIVTEEPPRTVLRPANNLVINEVFAQPPPNQTPYYWIEFYNPTGYSLDLTGWKLRFKTVKVIIESDSTRQFTERVNTDSVLRYYDVNFQPNIVLDTIGGNRVTRVSRGSLEPNSFITVVSDEARMLTYTEYGHGSGLRLSAPILTTELRYIFRADTLQGTQGDSIVMRQLDTCITTLYAFFLGTSGQLVLKDSAGVAKDVFRYGSYVYDDFSESPTDPYPFNHSQGPIVPFQSYARFYGAYTSGSGGNAGAGNSAADFYITGMPPREDTHPIPQWLSQAYKEE